MEKMVVSWKIPPPNVSLPKKDIHIWRAALDLPSTRVEELKEKLSIEERIRADRFRFERDRDRFIVGVGILRTILGDYLSVAPSELGFSYGEHGKPRLSDVFGNKVVHFNMSHSEGLALYVFSRDHEAGVDLERTRDFPEMEQIVEQFFSVKERVVFNALPISKKRKTFFN